MYFVLDTADHITVGLLLESQHVTWTVFSKKLPDSDLTLVSLQQETPVELEKVNGAI